MSYEDEDEAVLLRQQVEAHPDDSSHRFNLGKYLWERGWKEKAGEHLLMAAKLNPQNGEAFRYLGHYYYYLDLDTHRALKCYQRAVSLDPNDSHAGEAICNLLDEQGKQSLEVGVCKEASAKSPRAFWAFSRLGFLLVHQKKWSEAVPSLQHAIRGYPTCADLWEALGLAYQRLGMYTAAIKSYGRALELEDSRVFAMIESGNVLLMLGLYRKGIEQFQWALGICPYSVSANYGLASGQLAMSKEFINQGAFAWAASLLEEATEVAKSSTVLAANMPCVWKLYADIQLTYARYFPWTEGGNQKDEESFSQSLLSWKRTRRSAAVSANCSYQRALHLAPWEANIYMDVAVVLDLIYSLDGCHEDDLNTWQLSEKMLLGSLSLEGDNYEFWLTLGCFSGHKALRQHAFIRGLQLDVSLASAWAHLGMLYREEGQNQLGRQAFDRARSIDPSLALPWAGMSADLFIGEPSSDEAYESCLRAVQIMHVAEFQIGLAKLALLSGHLLSSEVFAAIIQAVQCAPFYPESHNLNGLVFEARHDYESAICSYRLARYALKVSAHTSALSHLADVSVNLARALFRAGNVRDAVIELDNLKERGLLDVEGLQIYAVSLWKLGKNDMALSAANTLTECVSSIKQSSVAASICLICSLLFCISGTGPAINSILRIPRELLQSAKVSFLISAMDVVDHSSQLQPIVSSSRQSLSSPREIVEMHLLIALQKLVRTSSGRSLNLESGIDHLRKALHMYPSNTSLRNMLGYFLLSRLQWENSHVASRCCVLVPSECSNTEDLRSAHENIGAEAVACLAFTNCKSSCSFSGSKCQGIQRVSSSVIMQRWFHQEPWNHNARYLLVLNLLQRARETRYPHYLISMLKRMTFSALASQLYLGKTIDKYKRFQLLLCSSEISLLCGDTISCVSCAKDAKNLLLSDGYTFFAHLQLCRARATERDHISLTEEFNQCLKLRTDIPVGWINLKFIESRYKLQNGISVVDSSFGEIVKDSQELRNSWLPVYNLFCGLIAHWNGDYPLAERLLAEACSSAASVSCFFLCHGVICMELAKKQCGSPYLTMGARSLRKAQEFSSTPLPYVFLLLAQAEASFGSKIKWEHNLHLEWSSWLPGERPAELYFQIHLIAIHGSQASSAAEDCKSARNLVIRAIHLNPSCSRYWKILWKLAQ